MFSELCSVNDDSVMEVYEKFDVEDDTLFIGIFEENGNGGVREQSVWLSKSQVFKLYKHLESVLKGSKR